MNYKLLIAFFIITLMAVSASAQTFQTIFNPFTGKLDFYNADGGTVSGNILIGGSPYLFLNATALPSATGFNVSYYTTPDRTFNLTNGDSNFTNLTIRNLTIPQYVSCTALETDATGRLMCGVDDDTGGSVVVETRPFNNASGNIFPRSTAAENLTGVLNISATLAQLDNITLTSFASCNLDTDSNGRIVCGADADTVYDDAGLVSNWTTYFAQGNLTGKASAGDVSGNFPTLLVVNTQGLRAENVTTGNLTVTNASMTHIGVNNITIPAFTSCTIKTDGSGIVTCGSDSDTVYDDAGLVANWTDYFSVGNLTGKTAGGGLTGTYPNPTVASAPWSALTSVPANIYGWLVGSDVLYNLTGRVGIGLAAPIHKLHVTGSINSSDWINATNFKGNGALLTALNADNIATGTLADARISFTLQDAVDDGGCTDCITDSMVSNTLTASDLVAGSEVVADSEVVDAITLSGGTISSNTITAGSILTTSSFVQLEGNLSIGNPANTEAVNITVESGYWCIGC